MRKIRLIQSQYEWKLCFLGGERGGYEPRIKKRAPCGAFSKNNCIWLYRLKPNWMPRTMASEYLPPLGLMMPWTLGWTNMKRFTCIL